MSARILVIEDDASIRRFLRGALEHEGFLVEEATDGASGVASAMRARPELIVLDLGLPDRDGVEVTRDVRRWSTVPILILSARATEDDKIDALDAGADDYLTKPFGVGELMARTRALLRRHSASSDEPVVVFSDVHVDLAHRTVTRGGTDVHLTPIEYKLLALLIGSAGRVLTHRQLLREVWGPEHVHDPHYLRIYVANLRHKLEADPTRPRHFITETGVGYRFRRSLP